MHHDPVSLSNDESGQQFLAPLRYKVADDYVPQAELDALTRLASYLCQTPISLITFTGASGYSFITHTGLDVNDIPKEISFCAHTMQHDDIYIIEDAIKSTVFREEPIVANAPFIRFFAGIPIKNPDGQKIGALCVMDRIPRSLTSDQKDALFIIGKEITAKLELYRKNHNLEQVIKNEKEKNALHVINDLADYKYALDKTAMISIIDRRGIINYVNDKFCEISKFDSEDLIGKEYYLLNSYFHTKEFLDIIWETITKGKVYQNELKNKAKDGTYFWVATTIFPFLDNNGRPYKFLTISYDVTQKKLQEKQLIEVKVLAEKLSKSKDIFLTNMSHEIRTPLNAITGLGKLLSKTDLDSQQRTYINGIESASDNLMSVINDLLDFSKIEAGKITIENISFNFEMICHQAINILSHKAEEKGLEIACEIDQKIAPILIGDPFRINQVFMNMLGNAIKFTERGHIYLKATLIEEIVGQQRILVNIEDTGVGIQEEYLKSIFDKFTQEDETVVRKFGGTGLGMSITKELMELMNGSISVKSRKDIGTTISLIFNFKIGTSRVFEKKRTIKNETANIHGKKILLVEDNNLNRLLAKTILMEYGAVVTEAENGLEAVNMTKAQSFDIILMDVQMPVMDGLRATQIIRKEVNQTVPIIALTANAIKGKLDQFYDAGMDDHIFKPYDEIKLVNPIAKWLKKNTEDAEATEENLPVAEPPVKIAEALNTPPVIENQADPATPLYNINKLMEMSGKNTEFINKMLLLFINEVPQSLKKIKDGYSNGDLETVKYYAHMIKPSIFNLCINDVKNDVLQIESMAENGENNEDLVAKINKLDKVIHQVIDKMKQDHNL